jgi:RNA polymerase sigma factor (sigma-70 family)
MSINRMNFGIDLLRLRSPEEETADDGQLLERFLTQRDEAAFAVLVRRHGPMVLGVCRRILGNAADADDAFQAVFLVLVRKGSSLTGRTVLGDLLHGVARHTALKVKVNAARRRVKEQATARPVAAYAEEVRNDWLPLLDEQLSRLPEKYRLPILLCDLEGRTRAEVASQLGWPEGTVAGRLARGRALLAKRLLRVTQLLCGLLPGTLAGNSALGALSPHLVISTVRAGTLATSKAIALSGLSGEALTLAEGVMRTMFWNKMKNGVWVLLATGLLACVGGLTLHVMTGGGPATAAPMTPSRTQVPAQKAEAVEGLKLTLAAQLVEAPVPESPPLILKKLGRAPDPSPDLRKELYHLDKTYRHGAPEQFVELEEKAKVLVKQYLEKDDQARIWGQLALIAGQSGIDKHVEFVRKYAAKCLEVSRNPLDRSRMYSMLASTLDLGGTAFAKGRREAAVILLKGYREMLAQELPEIAPELPGVEKIGDIIGEGGEEAAKARARHAAQMAACEEAEFIREQIGHRETLVLQLRELYKPNPILHGRSKDGPEELQALAAKSMTDTQVHLLMKKTTE